MIIFLIVYGDVNMKNHDNTNLEDLKFSELARISNIKSDTIRYRVQNQGLSKSDAISYETKKTKIYTTKNGESGSATYFSKKYNINLRTLLNRLKRSKMTIDEAINF